VVVKVMAVAGGINVPLFVRFSIKQSKATEAVGQRLWQSNGVDKLGSKDTFSHQLENSASSAQLPLATF